MLSGGASLAFTGGISDGGCILRDDNVADDIASSDARGDIDDVIGNNWPGGPAIPPRGVDWAERSIGPRDVDIGGT